MESLPDKISHGGKRLWQTVISLVWRYIQIGARWTGRSVLWALKALYQGLGLPAILQSIQSLVLATLKWCGIALIVIVGGPIVALGVYWCTRKLLQVYCDDRQRRLEERRLDEAIARHEAYLSRLQARQASEAAAATSAREAKLQAAQEAKAAEDELKRKLRAAEQQKREQLRVQFEDWEKEIDGIFHNRSSMTRFPFPPLPRCTHYGCRAFLEHPVPACPHNVEQFLRGSGKYSLRLVKEQRNLWHEDRFASCRTDLKPEFKRLANSLFVVLDPMYEELKSRAASSLRQE